jgi:hypothetical protein
MATFFVYIESNREELKIITQEDYFMLKKMRRPLTILVCLLMLFSMGGPIWARDARTQQPDLTIAGFGVSPMMLYINRVTTLIYIGTYGETEAYGQIYGYPDVDEVWIYLYLERYVNGSWQVFNSWSATFNSFYGSLDRTDVVPHGYTYRVRGSYYAWSGSNYDHVYGYSSSVYY